MATGGRPAGYCSIQAAPFRTFPRGWEPPQHTPRAPAPRHGPYRSATAAWSLACLPSAGPPVAPLHRAWYGTYEAMVDGGPGPTGGFGFVLGKSALWSPPLSTSWWWGSTSLRVSRG